MLSQFLFVYTCMCDHHHHYHYHHYHVVVVVCLPCAAYRCRLKVDLLLVDEIALVADEQLVHIFICVAVNFVQPRLDIRETVFVSHVIDDDDAMRAAVIRAR